MYLNIVFMFLVLGFCWVCEFVVFGKFGKWLLFLQIFLIVSPWKHHLHVCWSTWSCPTVQWLSYAFFSMFSLCFILNCLYCYSLKLINFFLLLSLIWLFMLSNVFLILAVAYFWFLEIWFGIVLIYFMLLLSNLNFSLFY